MAWSWRTKESGPPRRWEQCGAARLFKKDVEMGNLILSRKVGQKIILGQDITIEVHELRGDRVSLRIQAPLSVMVWRGELVEKKEEKAALERQRDATN